jgi:hypothetical protein
VKLKIIAIYKFPNLAKSKPIVYNDRKTTYITSGYNLGQLNIT